MTADREVLREAVLKALRDEADERLWIDTIDVTEATVDRIVDAVLAGVTWRDEWRVVAGPFDAEYTPVYEDEIYSEEHLEIVLRDANKRWQGEHIWSQRRKVGTTDWERVTE